MKRGPTTFYDLLAAYSEVLWRNRNPETRLIPTKLPPITIDVETLTKEAKEQAA